MWCVVCANDSMRSYFVAFSNQYAVFAQTIAPLLCIGYVVCVCVCERVRMCVCGTCSHVCVCVGACSNADMYVCRNTSFIAISTLTSEMNFYTKLISKIDPLTQQPVFKSVQIQLACQQCIDNEKVRVCVRACICTYTSVCVCGEH